jgi:dihydroxyacetone kinase-like predicted kinase
LLPPLLQALSLERCELLSLYYGDGVTAADAGHLGARVENLYPEVEVEIIATGTPHYAYLFGAE